MQEVVCVFNLASGMKKGTTRQHFEVGARLLHGPGLPELEVLLLHR